MSALISSEIVNIAYRKRYPVTTLLLKSNINGWYIPLQQALDLLAPDLKHKAGCGRHLPRKTYPDPPEADK